MIAGAPDGENTGFAYPEELEQRLRADFNYRLELNHRLKDSPAEAVEEITELIDQRFKTAKRLIAEHDLNFMQITTFYINSLHHFYWDDDVTLQAWKIIDEHIGDIFERTENVVLMSDHGSNEIKTVFNINTWLENQGYLHVNPGVGGVLHDIGITTDALSQVASTLGVRNRIKQLAPQWLVSRIPDKDGEFRRGQKTDRVEWGRTEAIASGQGPIYLTAQPGTDEYERVREKIINDLTSLTGPDGRLVTDDVLTREEVYEGRYIDEAPDIVIDQRAGVHIPGTVGADKVFTSPGRWSAENKRYGLFAATGPAFGSGDIGTLSILDLAPTLLHLHDHSVPENMDGSVRKDVFAPGSDAATRPVQTGRATGVREEIKRVRSIADTLPI
jgi:predicted AlkP superfamily phosphohydrolase/phosphomutase